MTRTSIIAVWVVAAIASVATGCSNAHTPIKVNGTVTLDGKPIEGASVTFYRIGEGKEGRAAGGRSDAEGRFQLSTMADNDGVLPGEYVAVVSKWVSSKPSVKMPIFPDTQEGRFLKEEFMYKTFGDGPKMKNAFPARYSDMANSPFRFMVTGEMTVQLELSSN